MLLLLTTLIEIVSLPLKDKIRQVRMDKKPSVYVMLSAALFGISPAIAKLLVADMPSVALAGLLYLGAFIGLFLFTSIRKLIPSSRTAAKASPLEKRALPWLAGASWPGASRHR